MRRDESIHSAKSVALDSGFLSVNPEFKKDIVKSIFFAVFITVFEIALYFIYYLRVFERR